MLRILVRILVCSLSSLLGIGLLQGQTYPNFNGGTVNNSTCPSSCPTGGPTQLVITASNGSTFTENGLAPGAQVNLILVQQTASWTSSQAQTIESAVSTGVSQSWPGPPYVDYPSPTSQVTDTMPTIDPNTGFQDATTQNVISVVVAVSQADMLAICGSGSDACTASTFDPTTGYVTSSLTYISANYQNSAVEEHEVVGHGLDSLTDCTSCNSLMNSIDSSQAAGFTDTDLAQIYSDVANPAAEPVVSCTDPCNSSCYNYDPSGASCQDECGSNPCYSTICAGYSCNACGTNCGSGCTSDNDCPGGYVCMGGTCGCGTSCDDPSCSGYDACECQGQCADPSCDGNYDCDCLGECGGGGGGGSCYWYLECYDCS